MDTAWIQVFVLTLSECVAPSGKTVCQPQEAQFVFYDRRDCEAVLQELVAAKKNDPTIIVNPDRSRCLPTARQRPVFASLDDAERELGDTAGWGIMPPGDDAQGEQRQAPDATHMAYADRLQSLPECNEQKSVTPCKVGQIIVESPPDRQQVEIWKRED